MCADASLINKRYEIELNVHPVSRPIIVSHGEHDAHRPNNFLGQNYRSMNKNLELAHVHPSVGIGLLIEPNGLLCICPGLTTSVTYNGFSPLLSLCGYHSPFVSGLSDQNCGYKSETNQILHNVEYLPNSLLSKSVSLVENQTNDTSRCEYKPQMLHR